MILQQKTIKTLTENTFTKYVNTTSSTDNIRKSENQPQVSCETRILSAQKQTEIAKLLLSFRFLLRNWKKLF